MRIKILTDIMPEKYEMDGSNDWRNNVQYHAGEIADFDTFLAHNIVANGDAEHVE